MSIVDMPRQLLLLTRINHPVLVSGFRWSRALQQLRDDICMGDTTVKHTLPHNSAGTVAITIRRA